MIMQLSGETEALPLTVGKIKDEYEDSKEPTNAGAMSPPLSPASASSPPPTMVPMHCAERDTRDQHDSISPSRNSPNSNLQQTLHSLQGLHNLHNLQNFRNLHSLQSQIAAFAGLQQGSSSAGLGSAATVNSLLNAHFAANARQEKQTLPPPEHLSPVSQRSSCTPPVSVGGGGGVSANGSSSSGNNQGVVPQMVLTSGQVAEGVQGAQLLIPTSQGIAVQPILTIPLGQTSTMSGGSFTTNSSQINSLAPLLHSHHHQQHQQPHIPTSVPMQVPSYSHNQHPHPHTSSAVSSPLPPSSAPSSSVSNPHPLLGVLSPSLFHNSSHHGSHNNNNNANSPNNNNNIGNLEKPPKMSLPLSSPVHESINSLSARMSRDYWHHPTPSSRYSPDFLDTHDQPTISQATSNLVDGVNLDEIKEFAKAFKLRRLSLGLTQTQVGQALSITEGPAYSQSAICRFEKLDITPKSAQKIKPVLEHWMQDAEERYKNGHHTLTDYMGSEPSKKRKRRTSFTPQALEILNAHFERNTHPSGAEITAMGEQLGYEREVVRIWFCNKRQALKNTVRMMSRPPGSLPPPQPSHLDSKHDDLSLR